MNTNDNTNNDKASRAPRNATEIIGNQLALSKAQAIMSYQGNPPTMYLTGPSGSGKSATINYVCKLAACHSPVNGAPCCNCRGCEVFKPGYDDCGLFAYNAPVAPVEFHYVGINCRYMKEHELHKRLEDLRYVRGGIRVIHLEEAANLKRFGCDESITDIMDDPAYANCRWFASSVNDYGLDPQFRRRWAVKVSTSPATEEDFDIFLARRCKECKIDLDIAKTIRELTLRSWQVPGLALALLDGAMLTKKLDYATVKSYPFTSINPWSEKFFET